jgi:acetyl-CoA carboxylase carboxyltransferase component
MCADIPVAANAAGCAVAGAVAVVVMVDRIFCTQDPEFSDLRGYDTIPILHAMAMR